MPKANETPEPIFQGIIGTTWQVIAASSSFMAMKGGKSCASSSARETVTTGSS